MPNDSDVALPKALTDFVFDLYDSVTLSQLAEEQTNLYETVFRDLSSKYFGSQPWPSPQSIASECNGDPLFLAIYREMTHRHWHQTVSRPTIRDCIEGWHVYRELFEEILEAADDLNCYLLPGWTFDILNEFVYQFQGFCQIRSAVYNSARKHGLLLSDGSILQSSSSGGNNQQHSNLLDNLNLFESASDAWDVETVFGYLHRLIQLGFPNKTGASIPPVCTYLGIFSAVTLSRLECLLGDYTACLQVLTPLSVHGDYVIPKDDGTTVSDTLLSVFGSRVSLAYHAGVSYLMLRRYKDAIKIMGQMCATMQRGFKTGQLRRLPGSEQFNKQFDRMLALLAILQHVCPTPQGFLEDSVARAIREKHGAQLEAALSYEEWFQSPKFISIDPQAGNAYRHQVALFSKGMEPAAACRKLRSYLKLYTSLPVQKLAKFHDRNVDDFLPLLLSYKVRMNQLERDDDQVSAVSSSSTFVGGTHRMALDFHYYVTGDHIVHVDEAEKQRRFENYFVAQISQNSEICRDVVAIDTNV